MFEKKNYWILCYSLFDTKRKRKNKQTKIINYFWGQKKWNLWVAPHTRVSCQMQFKPLTVDNQIACWVVSNGAVYSLAFYIWSIIMLSTHVHIRAVFSALPFVHCYNCLEGSHNHIFL